MDFNTIAAEIVRNSEWYAKKHEVDIDEHFAAYQLIKKSDNSLTRSWSPKAAFALDGESTRKQPKTN